MPKPVARKRSMSMYAAPAPASPERQSDDDDLSESEDDESLMKDAADIKIDQSRSGWTIATNEQLFQAVSDLLPKDDNKSYSHRLKKMDWNKVKVKGYTGVECKMQLEVLIKKLRHVRTLGELIEDGRTNNVIKEHKSKAKHTRAKSAYNVFCAKLRKTETNYTGSFFALASERYKNLKPEEKFQLLLEANKDNQKKQIESLEEKPITPFNIFVKSQIAKGIFNKTEHKSNYKALESSEKLVYIRLAVGEVSNQSNHQIDNFSFLTTEELRLMQGGNVRIPTAYNLFIRDYCGVQKKKLVDASEIYRNLTPEQLKKYQDQVKELKNASKAQNTSIKRQPIDETPVKKRKKDHQKTPLSDDETSVSGNEVSFKVESPFKSPQVRSRNTLDISTNGTSSGKKRKLSESSSGKETPRKIKEEQPSEPTRVPTSLYQYYALNGFKGKPKKAKKAFQELDKDERKRIKRSFKKVVADYMQKLELYLKSLSKEEMNAYAKRSQQTLIENESDDDSSIQSDTN